VHYQAQLRYAEILADRDNAVAGDVETLFTVLLFLQNYQLAWRAFKDRATISQGSIEREFELKSLQKLKKMPLQEIRALALEAVPHLLD